LDAKAFQNVILITADEWRSDCLSATGHPDIKTPNLDALAADGTLFRNHFTQAIPCGPSRACLLTGMYLQNHRSVIAGAPLDARHTNIALEIRRAGIDPALFGYTDTIIDPRQMDPGDVRRKSLHNVLPGLTPVMAVDDHFRPWIAYLRQQGYAVSTDRHEVFRPKGDGTSGDGWAVTNAPALYAAKDSMTAFFTDEVIKYISVHDHRAWFVHLSHFTSHPPFVAPTPYNDMYDLSTAPPPVRMPSVEDEARQHPYLAHYLFNQIGAPFTVGADSKRDNLRLTDGDIRQIRSTYYGMISEFDAQVGRLIDYLKSADLYDNTLIVVTSDHGEHLGDHWMFAKFSYFDQSFRIPLIVRDPTMAADGGRGHQVDAFTESVDVMPTILDWLGLAAPAQCDGESVLPFCHGTSPHAWRSEVHAEFDFRDRQDDDGRTVLGLSPEQCSLNIIRDERYKYVHFTALPPLFFDLANDPNEFVNLADDPEHQSLVLEYAQKLLSWRMAYNERILPVNTDSD